MSIYQMLVFMGFCVAFAILFLIVDEINDRNKQIKHPNARYQNYMILEDGTIVYPKIEEVNPNGQYVDIVIK